VEDTEGRLHYAALDQVAVAANQPLYAAQGDVNGSVPEHLFHLLGKALLLKHLRKLKAEQTVNGTLARVNCGYHLM
jgi:hypothetical protein